MNKYYRNHLFLIAFILTLFISASCKSQEAQFIAGNNKALEYMGRVAIKSNTTELYWSGTSVRMAFEGTSVKAILRDEGGDNYFNAIIDDTIITRIKSDTTKRLYTIAENLLPGKHAVQLFKLTEGSMGKTWFYGFQLGKNDRALPNTIVHKRKIEFYGNSITSGYSLEDTLGGDSGAAVYFNNYLSYAALTARHYNADYRCISKSGIGIMVSWFPVIMPELYDRLDPNDSASKWDFSLYTPDVVVINLLQNDSWLVHKPENPQFKARFGTTPPDTLSIINAYKNFVATIRGKYPHATIICVLGSMDATKEGSPWPGYITAAVGQLKDRHIFTHFFPYKNTPGHPKKKEQQAMAESLISFIDANVKW